MPNFFFRKKEGKKAPLKDKLILSNYAKKSAENEISTHEEVCGLQLVPHFVRSLDNG